MLARRLRDQGHQVRWWASAFSHTQKRFRGEPEASPFVRDGIEIHLIPALGYRRHVSLQRLADHRHVAEHWERLFRAAPRPDVIVASYPTIEICAAASRVARDLNLPLLMDIRDQYPDLYWENAPAILRPWVRLASGGMRKMARAALSGADAITANGPEVVQWGLNYAGRAANAFDQTLFMSYEPVALSEAEQREAEARVRREGWVKEGELLLLYTGMIGQTLALEPVLEAARQLQGRPIRWVFCGGGDLLDTARQASKDLPNVHFTGWLDAPTIQTLQRLAHAGLVPYRDRKNFETGITNKPVEYLAQGLPILTSLQRGTLVDLLKESGAGLSYSNATPHQLVNALVHWMEHPEERQEASAAVLALFDREFHPDNVYGRWVSLIEAVVQSRLSAQGQSRP